MYPIVSQKEVKPAKEKPPKEGRFRYPLKRAHRVRLTGRCSVNLARKGGDLLEADFVQKSLATSR
jgi:hypothetical protein